MSLVAVVNVYEIAYARVNRQGRYSRVMHFCIQVRRRKRLETFLFYFIFYPPADGKKNKISLSSPHLRVFEYAS